MSVPFPKPVSQNGRLYFDSRVAENYKRALADLPLLPENPNAKITLVTAAEFAADLGIGRRTLGRRVANSSGVEAA